MNKYILVSVLLAVFISVKAENTTESTDTIGKDLAEIEVMGKREIHMGEYDRLYLSKQNESFGSNALDAISSLNRFITSINSTELVSKTRENVFIVINGVPADGRQLRSYKADQIKYVEYYPTTPGKYLTYTQGPVLDVIVKKKYDRLYQIYVNTFNELTYLTGINSVDATYTDSLNRVNVNYGIGYNGIRNIKAATMYDYSGITPSNNRTEINSDKGKYNSLWQWVGTTYQRYQGSHLFNANISYSWSDDESKTPAEIKYIIPGSSTSGTNNREVSQAKRSLNVDLYYRKAFGNNMLQINVVNTFGNNFTDSRISRYLEDKNDLNYDLTTNQHNTSYELTANASFSIPTSFASFAVTGFYCYSRLKQIDSNILFTPSSQSGLLYATAHKPLGNFQIFLGLGGRLLHDNTSVGEKTDLAPHAILNFGWFPQGKLSGLQGILSTNYTMIQPSLGQLTDFRSYIDRYYLQIGNPYLKSYNILAWNLNWAYYWPDGRNMINLKYRGKYYDDMILPTLFTDSDDIAYRQMNNIGNYTSNVIILTGSWYPWSFLEVSPFVDFTNVMFDTPTQKVRHNSWSYGGSVTFYKGPWTASLYANSPIKQVEGDFKNRLSPQYGASVYYQVKGWMFGLKYHYSGENDTTSGECPGFSFYTRNNTDCYKHSVSATITYSFSQGRARRHAKKGLQNTNTNDGIVVTPDKPK